MPAQKVKMNLGTSLESKLETNLETGQGSFLVSNLQNLPYTDLKVLSKILYKADLDLASYQNYWEEFQNAFDKNYKDNSDEINGNLMTDSITDSKSIFRLDKLKNYTTSLTLDDNLQNKAKISFEDDFEAYIEQVIQEIRIENLERTMPNFELRIVSGKSLEKISKSNSKNSSKNRLEAELLYKPNSHLDAKQVFDKFLLIRQKGTKLLMDFLQHKQVDIAVEEVFSHFFDHNPVYKGFYQASFRGVIISLTQEFIKANYTKKLIKETETEALEARKEFITYLYQNPQGQNLIQSLVIQKFVDQNQKDLNKILASEVISTFLTTPNSIQEHFIHNFAQFATAIDRLSLQAEMMEDSLKAGKISKKSQNYASFIDQILVRVGAVKTDPYNRRLASLVLGARNQIIKQEFEEVLLSSKSEQVDKKQLYKKTCKKLLTECLNSPEFIGFKALRIYKDHFGDSSLGYVEKE